MRTAARVTIGMSMSRAAGQRTVGTRSSAIVIINTLRARSRTWFVGSQQPPPASSRRFDFTAKQARIPGHPTAPDRPKPRSVVVVDERAAARSFYSAQIYHGQRAPNSTLARPSGTSTTTTTTITTTTTTTKTPSSAGGFGASSAGAAPATGAGTGVLISEHMFGAEVKGNPTESEADVAADRCDVDPLPPERHQTIRMPAGEAAAKPTESEEDVAADRGRAGVDPLAGGRTKKEVTK